MSDKEEDARPKTGRRLPTGQSIRPATAAVEIERFPAVPYELPKIIAEQPGGEDDDEGMFSFGLPPANPTPAPTSQNRSAASPDFAHSDISQPVSSSSHMSPAAAYAAAFAKMQQDKKNRSAHNTGDTGIKRRSIHISPGTPTYSQFSMDEAQYEGLPPSAFSTGYKVGTSRSPVMSLDSRFLRARVRPVNTPDESSTADHVSKEDILAEGASDESPDGSLRSGYKDQGMNPDLVEGKQSFAVNLDDYDGDPLDLLSQFGEEEEDSPFPEVRASVSNIDDPEMPCLTFRSWVLGIVFTCVCSALNVFFNLRFPSPYITSVLVQIMTYPMGKLMAAYLPTTCVPNPAFAQRWFGCPSEWSFNPGPFNIKEHTIMVLMANASISPAYALNLTLVLDKYYNMPKGIGFDLLFVISTQMIGFALAGTCRRFLVWPAGMIWPENLVTCTLLNTFHAEDDDGRDGSMTRFRFFYLCFLAAGLYFVVPGFVFTALSAFSWVCWIAPNNIIVNQLFGVSSGLGMGLFTFDWAQIAYIGTPLVTPWWAIVNTFVGFLFFYWFLTPILYYTNFWHFAYMPINTSQVYDRFGAPYDVTQVLTPDLSLNTTAYEQYSPMYLPATYVSVYCIAFALATSALVHTALYFGPSIWAKLKNIRTEAEDVHAKLMRNYPEVPDWWYWAYGIIFLALAVVTIEIYDTDLPVWGLAIALILAFVYVLPGGFIYAMTAQLISINLLAELIPGFFLNGQPIAVMTAKTFSVQTLIGAQFFTKDLKLGHYMKIPPRATFMVQIIAAFFNCLVQMGTKAWLVASVEDLCDPFQPDRLVCPQNDVFFNTSVIWGIIGPNRLFGTKALYNPMLYFMLIGAILPVPFFFLSKRWPKSWLRYVNIPVMLTGASYIPPGTGINYVSWFIVGFIFQYWLRRFRFRWWSKFNFVASAAMDGGTIISGILIFLILQLPDHGNIDLVWWGNTVYTNTLDWAGVPYLTAPEEGFGPSTWSA